jgi:hypothetical protein
MSHELVSLGMSRCAVVAVAIYRLDLVRPRRIHEGEKPLRLVWMGTCATLVVERDRHPEVYKTASLEMKPVPLLYHVRQCCAQGPPERDVTSTVWMGRRR